MFEIIELISFSEVIINEKWMDDMVQEIDLIIWNNIWEIVDSFQDNVFIMVKWIYKIKKELV